MKMRRVLIIPDVHAPKHDKKAVEAVLTYASTQRYDDFVQLGDLGDFDSINGHTRDTPGANEGKRLKADMEACATALADFVYAARRINPQAKAHYLLGNHEDRVERDQRRLPAYLGITSVAEGVNARELGVTVYPYRKRKSAMRIGRLHFLHGSFFGETALKKHLDRLSCSFVMGHTHRMGIVTKPSQHGTMLAANLGYLGEPDLGEPYLDGPEGWQTGFGEAHVMPNGDFFVYPIPILRGGFVAPDGRYYSYKGWDRLGGPILQATSTIRPETPSHGVPNRNKHDQSRAPKPARAPRDNPLPRKSSVEAVKRFLRKR
jgi:hypothetical protein